jgi:hypothetical protein
LAHGLIGQTISAALDKLRFDQLGPENSTHPDERTDSADYINPGSPLRALQQSEEFGPHPQCMIRIPKNTPFFLTLAKARFQQGQHNLRQIVVWHIDLGKQLVELDDSFFRQGCLGRTMEPRGGGWDGLLLAGGGGSGMAKPTAGKSRDGIRRMIAVSGAAITRPPPTMIMVRGEGSVHPIGA